MFVLRRIVGVLACVIGGLAYAGDLGSLLAARRDELKFPGAAAALVRDGKIVAEGVCGVRKLGAPENIAPADLLMIGSCGKSCTRLLIGRLAERGLLTFDSTLAALLPDVPMRDEYRTVTIANILGHRGGIPAYTEISPQRTPILFEEKGTPLERRARFAAHVLQEPPAAPAGTRMVYSNAGYGLLGHIAERLAKKPFEELIRDEVFAPLQMKSAFVGFPNSGPGREGLFGHLKGDDGTFEPAQRQRTPLPAIAPAGLMSCSIGDFARLAAQLAACEAGKPGEFLKPETAARIRELRPGGGGSGREGGGEGGGEGEIFYGGDGLYTAAFALWPSKGVAIVVGTNAGESDEICEAIINAAREKYAPDVSIADGGPTPPAGKRPRFGFGIEASSPDDLRISQVRPGSPAEKAGLKVDDRIVAINGKSLAELSEEQRMQAFYSSPLTLTLERGGKPLTVTIESPN